MDLTWLVLLRREQLSMSARREYSGNRPNPNLTKVGRQQAGATARHLVALVDSGDLSLSAIVTPPQRRAQWTTETTTGALDPDIHVEEGLCETNFGQ